jgi:hypothetical protein
MISLGTDLVAGKNRVPRPATGKIAFVTFLRIEKSWVVNCDEKQTRANPGLSSKDESSLCLSTENARNQGGYNDHFGVSDKLTGSVCDNVVLTYRNGLRGGFKPL